jgi:hypothetical protein
LGGFFFFSLATPQAVQSHATSSLATDGPKTESEEKKQKHHNRPKNPPLEMAHSIAGLSYLLLLLLRFACAVY